MMNGFYNRAGAFLTGSCTKLNSAPSVGCYPLCEQLLSAVEIILQLYLFPPFSVCFVSDFNFFCSYVHILLFSPVYHTESLPVLLSSCVISPKESSKYVCARIQSLNPVSDSCSSSLH